MHGNIHIIICGNFFHSTFQWGSVMSVKDILVVKRTGEKVPYDVTKIKNSIKFAVADTGASQLELESKIDQFIKSGIKTSDIQQNIIQHAVQLATPQNPEWLAVAGRALAMEMWAAFKLRDKSFKEIVHYNIKKGEYAAELLEYYSDDDLDRLGYYIKHDRDLLHSHSSLITVRKKYLGKFELNQHMHMVNAMRFGQQEPAETRLTFVKSVYDAFSNREISLATPFMSNIRKGGNVASCFIVSIDDSMESIFDNVKRVARISKSGGGVGIYFGNIRAKGSPVSGVANAAGPITQWVKIFNDTLVAVNQSFVGDTLIDTTRGQVRIDAIVEGDEVLTHDGTYQKVVAIKKLEVGVNTLIEIATNDGEIKATTQHPVLVVDKVSDIDTVKALIINKQIKPYWIDIKDVTTDHYVIKAKANNNA